MTTLFKTEKTKDNSRRRTFWTLGGAASAAALALGLIGSSGARGQVAPLQITPLAQGSSTDRVINMHQNGSADVLQALLTFQPGAETGWHIHPGPVAAVVKSGALTETHANGCITVHPAGSVFFEKANEIHNATNQTGGVAEVFVTFISPAGAAPLIPATDPGRSCRPGE